MTVDKAALRKAAAARRAEVHDPARGAAAAARLLAFLAPEAGRPVAGYLPMRTEADPRPVMAALSAQTPVGVPVIEGSARPLAFHLWSPGTRLVQSRFGTHVPVEGVPMVPEVLIVPLLAFDRMGMRLGYGGGFYDRTLARLRDQGPVLAVGFAYAGQEVDHLPAEPTDAPLDAVVTEAGVIRF